MDALDTYGAAVDWKRATTVADGQSDGPHGVVVTVTGHKDWRSSNDYVQIVDIAAMNVPAEHQAMFGNGLDRSREEGTDANTTPYGTTPTRRPVRHVRPGLRVSVGLAAREAAS